MDEKVLFVDDDPGVLEGYKRALRDTFRMDTARSGREGLRFLKERGPYAVVVAEMEMPQPDGGEFLGQVREQSPQTVRIALSHNNSADTAAVAVNQAGVFRFLIKPCPLDAVISAIVAGINEYRSTGVKHDTVEVERIHPREAAPWSISLGPEIMTLLHASGRPIMMLIREEAARFMDFSHDLIRGTMVTISFAPGMKGYSFLCTRDTLEKLLDWLPHKAPAEIHGEIGRSGAGVGLLGVAQLLMTRGASWWWGALLVLAGFMGVIFPKRQMYYVNAVLLLLVGLADLVTYSPAGSDTSWSPVVDLLPVLMGGLLIIWFAHQISLTSPNQQLRAARAIRDKQAEFLPSRSPIVRRVGRTVLCVSLVFAAYAAAVLVAAGSHSGAGGVPAGLAPMLPDLAVFGILAMLLFTVCVGMATSKRPAYPEAKVAAQLVISVTVLSFWSVLLNLDPRAPASFFGHVFSPDLLVFDHPYAWGSMSLFGGWMSKELAVYARPYVWISLVACVVAFNWWFARSVDREMEDQRCQKAP